MNQLNILRCGDQNFWAYFRVAQEHSKYSQHNIEYATHNTVDLEKKDLIYIHSPDISNYHAEKLPLEAKERGIKVIGAYAGNPDYWSPAEKQTYSFADLIISISPQTYSFAKFHYESLPVIFLPESIDSEFFSYNDKQVSNEMIVGWAGGSHKKIKRVHIAESLRFPLLKKDDWKNQRRGEIQKLDLSDMRSFYNSIDVLISTSLSECQSRVIMESMACGLPVISTDVGSIRMLLDAEWIVPVNPEKDVIKAMNQKLELLKNNPNLRKEVGERNRKHIEKFWSWKINTLLWDKIFTLVYENKIDQIIDTSNEFIKYFYYEFKQSLTPLYWESLNLYNRPRELFYEQENCIYHNNF